jgi:hypothetical protein
MSILILSTQTDIFPSWKAETENPSPLGTLDLAAGDELPHSLFVLLSNIYAQNRVCPGQHLGSASVFIAMATILATLNISRATDADGNEIIPNPKMTTGLERFVLPCGAV